MRSLLPFLPLPPALALLPALIAQPASNTLTSFDDVQANLKAYCYACHQGAKAAAKLDLNRFKTLDAVLGDRQVWGRVLARVRAGEMPPRGLPAPSIEQRHKLVAWIETNLRTAACAGGAVPGPALTHRLNRDEYSATVRDLLNIQISAGHALPADGAGGEGFDNAAETLFLSPIHAEKYLEAAREALNYAAREPKARDTFLIAQPDRETSPEQAAGKILTRFLPRAFRRPATPLELERYLAIFKSAQLRKESFEESILYTLQGVLISPNFLFRIERPNPDPGPRLLGDYELASRISYFLWGSMPDQTLFDLAAQHKLQDPAVLKEQVARLLFSGTQRRDGDRVRVVYDAKLHEFARRFVEQWLGTRELGRDIKPDPKLFPEYYNEELQAAIRDEPVMFFQEILASNLSLLNLLDSKFIFVNTTLARHYTLKVEGRVGQQLVKKDLPEDSHRGGLLGMAAVAVVSSYSTRTSPVLRGKWVLDAILGAPPPPPPPNVPLLGEAHEGDSPKTLRERLLLHRQDPACASCHASIDPIGFGMENYDVLGRWRTEDAGKPIDTKGELPDGATFDGPGQLKAVLLNRKNEFIRYLSSKMLGYGLGRGLAVEDSCTVDRIVAAMEDNNYEARTLIEGIVLSTPFRYQAGTRPPAVASAKKGD